MRQPKTSGSEWLSVSMASFNGSGYAIKHTPQTYLDSYVAYKKWKRHKEAIEAIDKYYDLAKQFAEKLYTASPPGHTPSEKNRIKFMEFYIQETSS